MTVRKWLRKLRDFIAGPPGRSRASDTEKYKAHSSEGYEISSFITAILRREDEPRKIHSRTGVSNLVGYLRCLYKLRFFTNQARLWLFPSRFLQLWSAESLSPVPKSPKSSKMFERKKSDFTKMAQSVILSGHFLFPSIWKDEHVSSGRPRPHTPPLSDFQLQSLNFLKGRKKFQFPFPTLHHDFFRVTDLLLCLLATRKQATGYFIGLLLTWIYCTTYVVSNSTLCTAKVLIWCQWKRSTYEPPCCNCSKGQTTALS